MPEIDEEEENDYHAPFGDTFGTRADYSKGAMYAGHMGILYGDETGEAETDPLRPPPEFMTRQQSLKFVHMNKGDNLAKLKEMAALNESTRNKEEQEKKVTANKRKQLLRKKAISKNITIDKYSSTDPDDWEEEFLAGCRMWTNHSTGEVSEVCPYDETKYYTNGRRTGDEEENDEGTGAPVYDSSELNNLFDYLDTHPSPSLTPATSPVKTKE
jgi:hypothetical protein